MQHIHVHTPSGDQCQSPSSISNHSAPFSVLIPIRRSARWGKVHKSPHPTSLGDSSLRLPLSCRIAESSPHSHILVSLAEREAVSVRIWYNSHNKVASIGKNRGDKSHPVIASGVSPISHNALDRIIFMIILPFCQVIQLLF